MKRVSGKIYLPLTFFWSAIFAMYGKDRLGYDRFGQFMSGHVTMEYSLPKNFGSENFWDPKYFW